jgi:hypothetical protein
LNSSISKKGVDMYVTEKVRVPGVTVREGNFVTKLGWGALLGIVVGGIQG